MRLVKEDWRPWLWKEAKAIAFYGAWILLGFAAYQVYLAPAPPPVLPKMHWEQSAAALADVQALKWQLQAGDAEPREIVATCTADLSPNMFSCSAQVPEWALGHYVRLRSVATDGTVVEHSGYSDAVLALPQQEAR